MRTSLSQHRKARKKKVLSFAKGFVGRPKNNFGLARDLVIKKFKKQYIGRKQRKRQMRALWIVRINAAARQLGTKYSELFPQLHSKYQLNRKSLSEIAVYNFERFKSLCDGI